MLSFERVFAFLPNLTETQLKKVQERVEHLLNTKTDKKGERGIDLFYDALTKSLPVYYSRSYPRSKEGLKKTNIKVYKLLLKAYTELQTFLSTILGRNPIVEEFVRASYIFTELTAEDLLRRKIRPTLQAVLTNISSFPVLLEQGFPGYIHTGSAHFIFEGPDKFNKKKLKTEKDSKED
jgi:hypothetical protein